MIPELPSSQRMTEISRRWKALTDAERAAFNDDAQRVSIRFMRLTMDTGMFYIWSAVAQ